MTGLRCALGCALLLGTVGCRQTPPTAAAPPAAPAAPAFEPVLSVKELMERIVDPIADWVFDAVAIDVSAKGITETKPVTDEDWLKVENGALILAESSNLLKMHRPVAPPGDNGAPHEPGKPSPELSTDEIAAKINGDYALWQKHADELRVASLEALAIAKKRDVEALFNAGAIIDKACESCHLEYWYPGDKKAVEEDAKKTVTYGNKKP